MKKLPMILSSLALMVAATSSTMCTVILFNECKMPTSLLKED